MARLTRVTLAVSVLVAVASAACDEEPSERAQPAKSDRSERPAATPASERPGAEAEPAPLFQRTRNLMGTLIGISVASAPQKRAAPAVRAAFDEMARLEELLSEWKSDSEISRINRAAGVQAVEVSEETLAVVRAGLAVSRWSDGAYDLSWAALRDMYTFQPGEAQAPNMARVKKKLPLVDFRAIELNEKARTVFLKRKGMQIGTGSIAKGLALDRAADILLKAGLQHFMLFGGGQVQVHGRRGNRPWRVGIQHPRKNDYFAFVEVERGSISTSGDYEHAFIDERGERWHHIIDTSTGLPVRHTTSVTVIAQPGIYADALSTAVFVMGADKALARLDSAPGDPQIAVVDDDLKLITSPGLDRELKLSVTLSDGKLPKR